MDIDREEFLHIYSQNPSYSALSRKLGISVYFVKKMMKIFDVEPKHINNYICNHNLFSKDTESSFYLAGVLAADGNIRKNKKGCAVRLYVSEKDLDWILKIRKVLESNHKIYRINKGIRKIKDKTYKCADLVGIEIGSKRMVNDLQRFNIHPNKTHTLTFPHCVLKSDLIHHFMRGFSDGDGSFYIRTNSNGKKYVTFSIIGTKSMIMTYKNILEDRCNIHTVKDKSFYKNGAQYVLSYGGNGVVSKIYNFLYNDATIFLNRKKRIAKLAKNNLEIIRKNYTKQDIESAINSGASVNNIALKLNLSPSGVYYYLNKYDIKR